MLVLFVALSGRADQSTAKQLSALFACSSGFVSPKIKKSPDLQVSIIQEVSGNSVFPQLKPQQATLSTPSCSMRAALLLWQRKQGPERHGGLWVPDASYALPRYGLGIEMPEQAHQTLNARGDFEHAAEAVRTCIARRWFPWYGFHGMRNVPKHSHAMWISTLVLLLHVLTCSFPIWLFSLMGCCWLCRFGGNVRWFLCLVLCMCECSIAQHGSVSCTDYGTSWFGIV